MVDIKTNPRENSLKVKVYYRIRGNKLRDRKALTGN